LTSRTTGGASYPAPVSKAFKGEDASEAPLVVPPRAPLPEGVENYVTARGLAALKAEHLALLGERARVDASWITRHGLPKVGQASTGDGDRTHALAMLGARVAALEERLASARVVDPASQPHGEVRFGATVTVRAGHGEERRYRIVGVDEADVAHGLLAFVAPLARALLGKRAGDAAVVRTPRGEEELEVVRVDYEG
jgi:transcription elongation factor GreB